MLSVPLISLEQLVQRKSSPSVLPLPRTGADWLACGDSGNVWEQCKAGACLERMEPLEISAARGSLEPRAICRTGKSATCPR